MMTRAKWLRLAETCEQIAGKFEENEWNEWGNGAKGLCEIMGHEKGLIEALATRAKWMGIPSVGGRYDDYLWPIDEAGMRLRAAWCRRQAGKAKR